MKTGLSLIFVFFLAYSCHDNQPKLAGVPLTDYYNKCSNEGYDFGEMITIGDPNDKFMVTLPYEWEIQETYTDTIYGMVATNGPEAENDPEKFLMISFIGYNTPDSLSVYFAKEIAALKKDRSMSVLEAGIIDYYGTTSYWIKFENDQNSNVILNIVWYIPSADKNEIYLIQSSVHKTGDFDKKICVLKKLADSFELVR